MIAAAAFGATLYASTWLTLVMTVNAIAFAVVMTRARRDDAWHVGWWWIGFLIALGPVAVGRIDSITVPIAMIGMLAADHPSGAGRCSADGRRLDQGLAGRPRRGGHHRAA